MIIQPLCESEELGQAIAYARVRYESISQGARPRVYAFAYKGLERLLVRVVLGLDETRDQVQILSLDRKPQEWFFATNKWDKATNTFGPVWYQDDPGDTTPHLPDHLIIGDSATVVAVGGASAKPINLVSSNTAVCTISRFEVTYQDLVEESEGWADPGLIDLVHPDMVIAGFTVHLDGYGDTSFTLSQAGNGVYLPAPTIYSGPWRFRQGQEGDPGGNFNDLEGGACVGGGAIFQFDQELMVEEEGGACAGGSALFQTETQFTGSGGACAGGSALSFSSQDLAESGGACCGGTADFSTSSGLLAQGGVCAGGSALFATYSVPIIKPTVLAIPPAVIPFTESHSWPFQLVATPARGGTVTFRIVSKGGNCAVAVSGSPVLANGKWYGTALFSWTGVAGGSTSFSFSAIETKSGIASESTPSAVSVTVQPPIPSPTADFFEVTTSYETRDSLQLVLRGRAVRGGTLTYHIGAHNPGLVLAQVGTTEWSMHFYDYAWQEGYYINYWVTETKDGVSRDSALANVTIHVKLPTLPLVDFESHFPDTPAGSEWLTGQRLQVDYTGAGLMHDGSPISLEWEIITQPGPNMVYPDGTDSGRMIFTAIDAGAYTVKLTVSDTYGQSDSKVRYYECQPTIQPPTLKYPIVGTLAYELRSDFRFELDLSIDRKRDGVLTFQILGKSANCTVSLTPGLSEDGAGRPVTLLVFSSTASIFPASHWFTLTATETAGGVAAVSAPFTGNLSVSAPVTTPLVLSFAGGTLSWVGGTAPFKLYMVDGRNTPDSLRALDGVATPARSVAIPLTGGFCSISGLGKFTIQDTSRPAAQTKSILMTACGVPVCAADPLKITAVGANTYAVSGGTAPYATVVQGSVSNMTATFWNGNPKDLRIFSGFPACYCLGAGVRVSDALGASAFVAFAPPTISTALCTSGCPTEPPPSDPGWSLVWTCPLKDVRTNQAWMSGSTLVGGQECFYGYPADHARVSLISPNGQWRITGDYVSSLDVSFATYGCTVARMNADTGYNFGPASFPFCGGLNADANSFLIRTLERRNA